MLKIQDHGRARLLTLDRPEALNAFNDDLYDALREALRDAADHPEVAVVVLTGNGRAFSAGQDMGELGQPRRHDDDLPHGFGPFIEAVASFPKPLLAAVNGVGVGIGLTILPHRRGRGGPGSVRLRGKRCGGTGTSSIPQPASARTRRRWPAPGDGTGASRRSRTPPDPGSPGYR